MVHDGVVTTEAVNISLHNRQFWRILIASINLTKKNLIYPLWTNNNTNG